MKNLINIQNKLELALVYLAGLLLVLLMLIVSAESLLRKFANYSIPGVFEISSQLMVGVTILGIAYVQGQKEHIQLDIMDKVFKQYAIKMTNFISYLIGFVIAGIFGYQGLLKFIESFQTGETTMGIVSVPFWPGRLAIVIAMVVLCVRFLIDIALLFSKSEEKSAVREGVEDVQPESNEKKLQVGD